MRCGCDGFCLRYTISKVKTRHTLSALRAVRFVSLALAVERVSQLYIFLNYLPICHNMKVLFCRSAPPRCGFYRPANECIVSSASKLWLVRCARVRVLCLRRCRVVLWHSLCEIMLVCIVYTSNTRARRSNQVSEVRKWLK